MARIAAVLVVLALVAPARADELTVSQARALGRATGDDRDAAIDTLLHGALTDHAQLRRAVRRALVHLGGLSPRAARRLPSRGRLLTWLSHQLAARELSMTMVYTVVVTGEPEPGTLRIAAIPEACDDDFYVWAEIDVGPDGWSLVDAGIGDDC